MSVEYVISFFSSFFAVVVVLMIHEFAHAYVAYKCGDPTSKWDGRISQHRCYDFKNQGAEFSS